MYLGKEGAFDIDGNELPRLVYVSREKRPGYAHHKKAGAMNAMVSKQSKQSKALSETKSNFSGNVAGSSFSSAHKCSIHAESGL